MSTRLIKSKLRTFYLKERHLPSIRELCKLMGKSDNYRTQAQRMLESLVLQGFLAQSKQGRYIPGPEFFSYAINYGVRAGSFVPGEELTDYIQLDKYLIGNAEHTLLVTVHGDSMEKVLSEGDIVIVDTVAKPRPDEIVIAELNGEITIKYYKVNAEGVPYLEAANPKYDIIEFSGADEVKVVGVATRAIRSFK